MFVSGLRAACVAVSERSICGILVFAMGLGQVWRVLFENVREVRSTSCGEGGFLSGVRLAVSEGGSGGAGGSAGEEDVAGGLGDGGCVDER